MFSSNDSDSKHVCSAAEGASSSTAYSSHSESGVKDLDTCDVNIGVTGLLSSTFSDMPSVGFCGTMGIDIS